MNKWIVIAVVVALSRLALAGTPLPPHPVDAGQVERGFADARARTRAPGEAAGAAAEAGTNRAVSWSTWGVGLVVSGQELRDAYQTLTSADASCMNLSTLGAPDVPTSCDDDDASCSQCYREAYGELGEARFKLEKLHCIYSATKRFADKAISFGDSASGIHAVVGLEWQEQKKRINESIDQLNNSYDGKYNEFIPALKSSLEHIGRCEDEFFHEPDWYGRFGYIYFTFMSDRYKRSDK